MATGEESAEQGGGGVTTGEGAEGGVMSVPRASPAGGPAREGARAKALGKRPAHATPLDLRAPQRSRALSLPRRGDAGAGGSAARDKHPERSAARGLDMGAGGSAPKETVRGVNPQAASDVMMGEVRRALRGGGQAARRARVRSWCLRSWRLLAGMC